MGLECTVYMVKVSYNQKPYRRSMVETWGATIYASPSDKTNAGRAILKEDPDLRDIPVILLTAVDQAVFRTTYTQHMGLMTEADDYIAKPVEPEELAKRVEALTR